MGGVRTAAEREWFDSIPDLSLQDFRDPDEPWEYDSRAAVDGNGHPIWDHPFQNPYPEDKPRPHPELRIRGPVLDYFRARGWYVVFDPDGADFLDALLVRGDEVMVLELKTHAVQKAFSQALHRASWGDYTAVVIGSYESARATLDRLRNGGWDAFQGDATPEVRAAMVEKYGSDRLRYDGVGIYAVRTDYGGAPRAPYLVELRRPRRQHPKEWKNLHALRWVKMHRRSRADRAFARYVAYGYLIGGYRTTRRIPMEQIDEIAEGHRMPPGADPFERIYLPRDQAVLEEFSR